jgi:hypothetical protein
METYLREHPTVKRYVLKNRSQTQVAITQSTCSLCKEELGRDEIKIDTPKYGVICTKCWAKKMGEYIERNPTGIT